MAPRAETGYALDMRTSRPFAGGAGLSELSLADLKNLLERLHKGSLKCPIGPAELHVAGLDYLQDRLEHLKGLDERGVHAVVVAVIAERTRRQ